MRNPIGEYLDIDGCRAYVEVMGTGRPLMLFAPAGRENSHWRETLEHYSDRYTVIAPDFPGRGKSSIYSKELPYLLDVKDMVDFYYKILTKLGFDECAVMGTSLGGSLCYAMAAYYPDVVKAAIPCQGSIKTELMKRGGIDLLLHPQNNIIHGMSDNMESLIGRRASPEGLQFMQDTLANVNPRALHADLVAFIDIDLADVVHQIKSPVLAIHGTDDWLFSKSVIDETLAMLPKDLDVTYQPMAELGHFIHVERPEEVFAKTDPFLAKHFAPDGQ